MTRSHEVTQRQASRTELGFAAVVGLATGLLLVRFEVLAVVLLWTLAGAGALLGVLIVVNTVLDARRGAQVTPTHPERRRVQ